MGIKISRSFRPFCFVYPRGPRFAFFHVCIRWLSVSGKQNHLAVNNTVAWTDTADTLLTKSRQTFVRIGYTYGIRVCVQYRFTAYVDVGVQIQALYCTYTIKDTMQKRVYLLYRVYNSQNSNNINSIFFFYVYLHSLHVRFLPCIHLGKNCKDWRARGEKGGLVFFFTRTVLA